MDTEALHQLTRVSPKHKMYIKVKIGHRTEGFFMRLSREKKTHFLVSKSRKVKVEQIKKGSCPLSKMIYHLTLLSKDTFSFPNVPNSILLWKILDFVLFGSSSCLCFSFLKSLSSFVVINELRCFSALHYTRSQRAKRTVKKFTCVERILGHRRFPICTYVLLSLQFCSFKLGYWESIGFKDSEF